MVVSKNQRLFVNDCETFLLSAEIHYFRLEKKDWKDRILKAKSAGMNTIASYIPWLLHEQEEGKFSIEDNLDLAYFIDLCKENGLYFIARPGPFVMAELKNEGIPYWIYEKYPELKSITWDSRPSPQKDLDYLSEKFLKKVEIWYSKVAEILVPRLLKNGGNVVAVQLDNEIGMLQWVANSPNLSDSVLERFKSWLLQKYSEQEIVKRYKTNAIAFEQLRSPNDDIVLQFLDDYHNFIRDYYAEYVSKLREIAIENCIESIPFLINIHGTGGQRAFTFPIGVSQLYRALNVADDIFPGSDIYLGEITTQNFQDLHLVNQSIKCVLRNKNKFISCLEFECGNRDYGDTGIEISKCNSEKNKIQFMLSSGNKILNFYLFAGGINPKLSPEPQDGQGRAAFTGKYHGFAAPISPTGRQTRNYYDIKRSLKKITTDELIESDEIVIGFIPSYYREYYYPKNEKSRDLFFQTSSNRFHDTLLRTLLLLGHLPKFANLEYLVEGNEQIKDELLIIFSSKYMEHRVQKLLAEYVKSGRKLLLYGQVPRYNFEGERDNTLIKALEIEFIETISEHSDFYPTVCLRSKDEFRVSSVDTFKPSEKYSVIGFEYSTKSCCMASSTNVAIISTYIPYRPKIVRDILSRLLQIEINLPKSKSKYLFKSRNGNLKFEF